MARSNTSIEYCIFGGENYEEMRNASISVIKGIAIINVVIGHCSMSSFTEQYVNQYHLAIFFFVSGYFFKEKYIDDKRIFVWKKIKRLYVMFVISGLLFLSVHPLLEWMHVYDCSLTGSEYIMEVFNLTIGLTSNNPMMGAMWFCPALLGVSLLGFGLFCVSKGWNIKKRTALFAMAVILGGTFLHVFKLKSPYCVWQYLIITGIYYMGWLFHQIEEKLPKCKVKIWVVIAVVMGLVLYMLTEMGIYGRLQPANINNESVASIMLVAMTGCIFVYAMAKVISDTQMGKIVAMIGDYSFSIMLLHFLGFKAVNFLFCEYHDLPLTQIASFPTMRYNNPSWFLFYLLAGVFIPILLSKTYHTCEKRLASL